MALATATPQDWKPSTGQGLAGNPCCHYVLQGFFCALRFDHHRSGTWILNIGLSDAACLFGSLAGLHSVAGHCSLPRSYILIRYSLVLAIYFYLEVNKTKIQNDLGKKTVYCKSSGKFCFQAWLDPGTHSVIRRQSSSASSLVCIFNIGSTLQND